MLESTQFGNGLAGLFPISEAHVQHSFSASMMLVVNERTDSMPDRFTNSVRFKIGQSWVKTIESWVKTIEVVQVGDASGMWCLVPTDQPSTIKFVLEALNLKTAADEIVPKTIAVLEAQ